MIQMVGHQGDGCTGIALLHRIHNRPMLLPRAIRAGLGLKLRNRQRGQRHQAVEKLRQRRVTRYRRQLQVKLPGKPNRWPALVALDAFPFPRNQLSQLSYLRWLRISTRQLHHGDFRQAPGLENLPGLLGIGCRHLGPVGFTEALFRTTRTGLTVAAGLLLGERRVTAIARCFAIAAMLELGKKGIAELIVAQRRVLADLTVQAA